MCEDNLCLKPKYGSDIKFPKNPVIIGEDSPILMIEESVKNQESNAILQFSTANTQDEYLVRIGFNIDIPEKVIDSNKFNSDLGAKKVKAIVTQKKTK